MMKKFVTQFLFFGIIFASFSQIEASNCTIPRVPNGLIKINKKYVTGDATTVHPGSVMKISCQLGFLLTRGASKAICLYSGTWSYIGTSQSQLAKCNTAGRIPYLCGQGKNSFIYGGKYVGKSVYPWMARLQIMDSEQGERMCGGSLIDEQWILSAAHCFADTVVSVIVNLGRVNFTGVRPASHKTLVSNDIIKHPQYNQGARLNNDFALIKLHQPVRLSEDIKTICLPDQTDDICTSPQSSCRQTASAGWGLTKQNTFSHYLKAVNISVLADSSCVQSGLTAQLSNAQICAGSGRNQQGTCMGDSGGPLMCLHNNRYYPIGVVSYGINLGCGIANEPTVFGRVCEVMPWIRETIGKPSITAEPIESTESPTTPLTVTTETEPIITTTPADASTTEPVTCDRPRIDNARRLRTNNKRTFEHGDSVRVRCRSGYIFSDPDEDTITCENGDWTKKSCIRRCERIKPITNGASVANENFRPLPGFERVIKCNPGYRLVGRDTMRCKNDRTWTPTGSCQEILTTATTTTTRTVTAGEFTRIDSSSRNSGEIVYPENGGRYRNNANTCWHVSVTAGSSVKFTLTEAGIDGGNDRRLGDGLYVYDESAGSVENLLFTKIAGPRGFEFYAPNDRVEVCFQSDRIKRGTGFKLSYSAVQASNPFVVDCESIKNSRGSRVRSGVFDIFPQPRWKIQAYCEMSVFGGGWTVIHRRISENPTFDKPWRSYKNGFGPLTGSFWMGNENIYQLTGKNQPKVRYTLLINLEAEDGETAYLHLDNFYIENEAENYRLHYVDVPICNSTSLGLFTTNNHQEFSTYDRDNDQFDESCADEYANARGGWWYRSCTQSNLNALFGGRMNGILWKPFKRFTVKLKKAEMMIRRSKLNCST